MFERFWLNISQLMASKNILVQLEVFILWATVHRAFQVASRQGTWVLVMWGSHNATNVKDDTITKLKRTKPSVIGMYKKDIRKHSNHKAKSANA